MKKNIIYLSFAVLISSMFLANCNAASAYSVGGKFAAGTAYAGDDFTQNVKTASNAYGWISDINSYYNNFPTIDYLQSSSRFGGSRAFFINSHGSSNSMVIGTKNETNYKTGIYKEGNLCTMDQYSLVGMAGRSFSSTKVITFAGCQTGFGSNNLVTKAVAQGAKAAIGFKENIISRFQTGPAWLQKYNYALGNGYSVQTAINQATTAYPNDIMSRSVTVSGNISTNLGTASRSALLQKSSNFVRIPPIEETFKVLNFQSKDIATASVNNTFSEEDYLESIINAISLEESDFNINDYNVDFNIINPSSGYGQIFLTYYINGNIETNKVYLATVNNFELESIVLAGVTKQKMNNLNIASAGLITKVQSFNSQKQQRILEEASTNIFKSTNILTRNNKISLSQMSDDITDVKEKYYYDYNTNTLQYILSYVKVSQIGNEGDIPLEVFEGESVSINLD